MLDAAASCSGSTLNHHALIRLQKCCLLSHLKQIQAFLIARGEGQTQYFAFKLVRFCALKLGNLQYARLIFDHLRSPDIFLHTAMITAYASRPRHSRSAFVLYRDMIDRGYPRPDNFIYPHVLKSCPELLESRATEQVHSQILRSGFGQYSVVQTSLLNSYSRYCSDVEVARRLFEEISEKTIASWTAMMSWYAGSGWICDALYVFEKMPERDIFAWNALISGCAQSGCFSEAIALFRRMLIPPKSCWPDQITVACALSSCGHRCMLQLGRSIHGYVHRNGLMPDPLVSNALVDMYGRCGSLKQAKQVFSNNSSRSLTSWNSMINCFALHGNAESAIGMFEDMVRCRGEAMPDEFTFMGLLSACTHGGLVEKGQYYFALMTAKYQIRPQISHYGCLIDLLGRAGRFGEAMDVVKGMRVEPDETVWSSLLNGCMIHGCTDLAKLAVEKLVEIDQRNVYYYSMLAGMYGKLGKWDESQKVNMFLMEQKAHQPPGCSWIEVDNGIHRFKSGDKCHPRTEELYRLLEGFLVDIILKQ